MRPVHAVLLNQYARPSGSPGITRHCDIGAELVRRGHRVSIIASSFDYLTRTNDDPRDAKPSRHLGDGVEFIWLRTGQYRRNDSRRVRSMVRYAVQASLYGARTRSLDVVVGSSPHLLAGLAAAAVAASKRVPFVLEVRDLWPSALVDLGAIKAGSTVHRGLSRLERALYRSASRIITVPPDAWQRVVEVGEDPSKCIHIPNAPSSVLETSAPLPDSLRSLMNDESDPFVVVHAGAQGLLNDLDNVVAAACDLRSRHPEVYRRVILLLVGDGAERERLIISVAQQGLDRVRFHPPVPKSVINSLLGHAQAGLVHTAPADYFRYGLSPNKMFDYFAAGIPVLISSETPTVVDEIGAGLRFPPGKPAALSDAIAQIASLPIADRVVMGARGNAAIEDRYSLRRVATSFESVLLEAIADRRD